MATLALKCNDAIRLWYLAFARQALMPEAKAQDFADNAVAKLGFSNNQNANLIQPVPIADLA